MKSAAACQIFSSCGSCRSIKSSKLSPKATAGRAGSCFCGSCAKIVLFPLFFSLGLSLVTQQCQWITGDEDSWLSLQVLFKAFWGSLQDILKTQPKLLPSIMAFFPTLLLWLWQNALSCGSKQLVACTGAWHVRGELAFISELLRVFLGCSSSGTVALCVTLS